MKKISLIFSLLMLLGNMQSISAQCLTAEQYTTGSTYQITTYNNKSELICTATYKVEDVRKEPERILIMMKYITTNKKGKEIEKGNRSIIISGANYLINLSDVIKDFKSDDPQYIQYQCSPKQGDDIPEFSKVTTYQEDNMGQISIISNKVGLEDGKYQAAEDITTNLGTFQCYKIMYSIRFDNKDYQYTEWIDSKTNRMIKIERRDKKGEIDSYSELTSFTK